MRHFRATWRLVPAACLATALLLATLGGCTPASRGSAFLTDPVGEGRLDPRLSGFLTLRDADGPSIRMEVADIEMASGDLWLPLAQGPLLLDSEAIGNGQVFLGGKELPPDHYSKLRLTVTKAATRGADGEYMDILAEPMRLVVPLNEPLTLEPEDSRCLLVSWDLEESLYSGEGFRPSLNAYPPLRQLQEGLVFVSCPRIDTVFVVRADKGWVVDSFGIVGGPTHIAVDPDGSSQRLYVLTARDRRVKVVDLSSFRVVDFFSASPGDDPTFMALGADGREAFLLDQRRGNISRMDLDTGKILAHRQVDFRPRHAFYLERQDALAVSFTLSQKVSLLDADSLREVEAISSVSSPWGLTVADNELYIAEFENNSVFVADLNGRNGRRRLTVGFGPAYLLTAGAQIYVGNYLDGSLSVLLPGQLGVTQEIHGLGRPREMAYHEFYRRVYVADEGAEGLAVIDATANNYLGQIALGARPFGLAIIQ